jgi:DNA polymerase family B
MPRSIVAVACEHSDAVDASNPCRMRRCLSRWHAVAALLDSGRPGSVRESTGTDEASWWSSLDWLLRRGGVTWIISSPACREMALLGLWRKLEDGTLRIIGSDGRNGGLPPDRAQGVRQSLSPPDARGGGGADQPMPQVSSDMADSAGRMASDNQIGNQGSAKGYLVLEDPPTVVHCRVGDTTGTIHWVDSRNYGVSLDEPEQTAAERATALHRFALDMVGTLKGRSLGGLRDSSGSQAMASFRKKHLQSVIFCHTNLEALNLEGRAYYGGRAECHRIGRIDGPVYHYDVRSLYPSVAASSLLPVRLRSVADVVSAPVVGHPDDVLSWCADITLEAPEPAYPVRDGPIVVFPTGRFRTVLSGPELHDCFVSGRVVAWHAVATYDMEPALRSYAIEMDEIRQEAERSGNRPLAIWAKSLGVCLPGKFGQKDKRWQTVACSPPFGYYDEWHQPAGPGQWERWRTVAGVTQVEVKGSWHHDAVPAIAAYITSAGRTRLLCLLRTCGWDHCHYCDTDSLFCDEVGSGRLLAAGLVQPDRMGFLRLEGIYHEMEVRGIKDYSVDGRHVCAGLPKGAVDPAGGPEDYWWQPWIALSTRTHVRPTADVVLRQYKRIQPYRHGTILADGRVVPLRRWE